MSKLSSTSIKNGSVGSNEILGATPAGGGDVVVGDDSGDVNGLRIRGLVGDGEVSSDTRAVGTGVVLGVGTRVEDVDEGDGCGFWMGRGSRTMVGPGILRTDLEDCAEDRAEGPVSMTAGVYSYSGSCICSS